MKINRWIEKTALSEEFLRGRMCFIAGPRQVGKTTTVKSFLSAAGQEKHYYNWDSPLIKKRFALNPYFFIEDLPSEIKNPWVALDEIHKYPKWKNILKGYYDEWGDKIRFVVTGSARLDLFRKSGDSLLGRYFLFRMLPLGPREVAGLAVDAQNTWFPGQPLQVIPTASAKIGGAIEALLHLAGYPEPFSAGTQNFCNRWRGQHISLILGEDLRDLTKIEHIQKLETLLYLLPERVGAPLSLNSLTKPLAAAFGSIRLWLEALKMVYLIFSISPWANAVSRSILKEEKYYFWDWGMAEGPGTRFENFMAVQLARMISFWNELGHEPYKLYYLRTKDGREVDFVIADRKKPKMLIEVKEGDVSLSGNLAYFQKKLGVDLAVQVVLKKNVCIQKDRGLYIMGADRFFSMVV